MTAKVLLAFVSFYLFILNSPSKATEKILDLGGFERQVYCTISDMTVRLFSPPDGDVAYLNFVQDCNSRRSDRESGWRFNVRLLTSSGAQIRTLTFYYNHRCGNHAVELSTPLNSSATALHPVALADSAEATWNFPERVHNCG